MFGKQFQLKNESWGFSMYVRQRFKIPKMKLAWYDQKSHFCMDLVTDFHRISLV